MVFGIAEKIKMSIDRLANSNVHRKSIALLVSVERVHANGTGQAILILTA